MRPQAFVFDVDGTLVDSNDMHAEAWHRSFARHGFDVPAERVRPHIGKGGDKLVRDLLGDALDDDMEQRLRDETPRIFEALAHEHGLRRFAGGHELLQALRSRGLRTAVATSGKRKDFQNVVKTSGLDLDGFDEIVTGDDAAASKPDPDLIEVAVDRLGFAPAACVMIGDTPYDAEAAVRAGVACYAVLTGGHDEPSLRAAGASRVYRDLEALLSDLDQALLGAPDAQAEAGAPG